MENSKSAKFRRKINVSDDRDFSARLQEGKIAPLVGAEDLLRVKLGVAALRRFGARLSGGGAALEFGFVHGELNAASLHGQADAIAVAHEPKRPAGS